MKKRSSRALSLLLAFCLVLSLACLPAAAEEAGPSLALSQSSYDLGTFAPKKVGATVGTDTDFPPRYEFTLINQGDEPVTIQSITAETTDCVSSHSVVVRELSGGSSTFTLAPRGEQHPLHVRVLQRTQEQHPLRVVYRHGHAVGDHIFRRDGAPPDLCLRSAPRL